MPGGRQESMAERVAERYTMQVQVVKIMNWQVLNGESVKKSDQDLVDEMRLGVCSRDWVMHIEKCGF